MKHLTKLLSDSYALEENQPEKSAYWHLQKLRSEIKQLSIGGVSKRFIIEVFLNDRRLEYRASSNETDIDKELIELKRTYKSSNCIFYKGELNVC